MRESTLLQQVLEPAAVQGMIDRRREARSDLRLFPVADCLDQELAEGPPFEVELAEHIEYLPAEGLPRLLQLVEELVIDVALSRFIRDEVPEVTHFRLANAVNPTEPLLQSVGVPGQVVVHHQVGTLQVDAFAGRIRGEQQLHVRVVAEGCLGLESVLAAHAAVNQNNRLLTSQQGRDAPVQITQRIPVLGENDQFLLRRRGWLGNIAGAVGNVRLRDLPSESACS